MRRQGRKAEELKTITIRLPQELIKAAKMFAVEHGITLQELVRGSLSSRLPTRKLQKENSR